MDGVIDFNDIKNKAKEKDVDKLEDYIYSLYYSLAQGDITMAEMSKEIKKYMDDNNISEEKFFDMQKKLMERYGVSTEELENQMKNMGINIPSGSDYEKMRKTISFQEKYGSSLKVKNVSTYDIKNDINDIHIILDEENVTLTSEKSIDLNDVELNEFLCSYKKVIEDKALNITICGKVNRYNY